MGYNLCVAKIALSIRLKDEKLVDPITNSNLDLENDISWNALAEAIYTITFKPYFASQEIVVSFCEPEEIQRLNSMYRNINQVTDVLSFNAIGNLSGDLAKFEDLAEDEDEDPEDASIGDVVICVERAVEQAKEKGHSLKDELAFLFVHGVLHLLGYDHETLEEEIEMFNLQKKVLDESGRLALS